MTKLNRVMAAAMFAIGLQAASALARPVNLMQPTQPHRPDLDRMRQAEQRRQRRAARRLGR